MKNLPNETNDNNTFTSDHWFDREEVEPLRIGDKISFYHHVKDNTVLAITKEIHIKKETILHILVVSMTKEDGHVLLHTFNHYSFKP